uniref:Uncharacterized protein n=1 Tax=Avena sativa TaxID=4498 RepID=A0ACD5X9Q3_AVESA
MASDEECYDYESDYYDEDDGNGGGEDDDDAMEADDEDAVEEEDTPAPDRPVDCWAITKESLSTAQQEDLSMVMNLLNIKQHHARALLIHHRWKTDSIYDHFDRKGRDRMLREAGVVLQVNNSCRASPSRTVNCMVCFDEFSMGVVSTMECGHCFCNDCWTEYFKTSVDSGKKQIRCMGVKCPAICEEAVVHRLLGRRYPDAARRFARFLLESYLEDNDFVKWCPSVPHCGRAIRVGASEPRYCEVECPCGLCFCFGCASAAHSPCPCTMWDQWEVKCHGESETINWILANTKNCPKCYKPIVKEDGCNLVRCKCGQCLCWLCGGATGSEHTWTTIANHSCNRFVAEEKKVDDAKRHLHRYTHYYDRFKIHGDSYKTEREKLGPAVEERARWLETLQDHALLRDGGWLAEAHGDLLRSRQVLSRSYVFAYFMFGEDYQGKVRRTERGEVAMAQVLFEDYQEQLESHVERLSKVLATEFLPDPVEEDKILGGKQDALNLAKIVRTHCGEIYKCIQDELLPLLLDNVDIATYRPRGPDKAKEFQQ